MFQYFFYCLKFFKFLPDNISRYGPWERHHSPWARERYGSPMLFGADLSGMCLVILHDFPHQYTGQSTPHCLSAMVSRCCPQPANIRWTSLSCFIDGPTRPSPGLWNPNRRRRKRTARPYGHPQELIQTVAAATHAHARNPSQETIPCYTMPHDYGAMAPAAGEHRHANGVG